MKAAVDSNGRPVAWMQRSVFPPITSIFDVNAVYGESRPSAAKSWTDMPYDIPEPSYREWSDEEAHGLRIGWLRSVANIYHAFAVQTFSDELAHRAKRDPAEYLLDLIGQPRTLNFNGVDYPNYGAAYDTYPWETGRLRRVTEMVVDKSGWGKTQVGQGSGPGHCGA